MFTPTRPANAQMSIRDQSGVWNKIGKGELYHNINKDKSSSPDFHATVTIQKDITLKAGQQISLSAWSESK